MAYQPTGIVEELLDEWFSAIASWVPGNAMRHGGCTACADCAVALAMGITEWPHDLVHQIVSHSEAMAELMQHHVSAGQSAEQLVLDILTARAADAHDIFASCVAEPLRAHLRAEVEELIEQLRITA